MSNDTTNARTDRASHDQIASSLEVINRRIVLLQYKANCDGDDDLHDHLHDCYHAIGTVIDELRKT